MSTTLRKFNSSRRITKITCTIFEAPCNYDVILGRKFLQEIEAVLNFENNTVTCFETTVQMKTIDDWNIASMGWVLTDVLDSFFDDETKTSKIAEAKYEQADPYDVAK